MLPTGKGRIVAPTLLEPFHTPHSYNLQLSAGKVFPLTTVLNALFKD